MSADSAVAGWAWGSAGAGRSRWPVRSTRVPHAREPSAARLPDVPTASIRPLPSRTSTIRPSVSRAPHSRSGGGTVAPEDEEEEDGGCGWLSGIALQGLGLRAKDPRTRRPRSDKITQRQDHAE